MIETPRLIIKRPQLCDAESAFKNWTNNPNVCRFLSWSPHGNIEVTKEFISSLLEKNNNDFFIFDRVNDECIGSICVVNETVDHTQAEVGYVISEQYWNKGFMSEALFAFIDFLFTHFHYETITARHNRKNGASGSVMLKCGMHYTHSTEKNVNDKIIIYKNYEINQNDWMIVKLHHQFCNKFNENIPCVFDIKKLLLNIEDKGYLVKKAILFNDVIINNENPHILFYKNTYDNLIDFYIIAHKDYSNNLKYYLEQFVINNSQNIIDINDYNHLKSLPQVLLWYLKEKKLKISFAESCTGGLLASTLISVPTASEVIDESFVTYSEKAKMKYLGVKEETLYEFSVYSKEVAIEMAEGLAAITDSDVCVSITGLAGGNHPTVNDGSFDYAIIIKKDNKNVISSYHGTVHGTRNEVRIKQVNQVFFSILQALEKCF